MFQNDRVTRKNLPNGYIAVRQQAIIIPEGVQGGLVGTCPDCTARPHFLHLMHCNEWLASYKSGKTLTSGSLTRKVKFKRSKIHSLRVETVINLDANQRLNITVT